MSKLQHLGLSARSWRYLLNAWTIFLFIAIVWDFINVNAVSELLGPIAAVYTAVLAIYTTEKEFERWGQYYTGRHPGEMYVILWTLLVVGIFGAQLLLQNGYTVPHEITATYVAVLGILAITRKSKSYYSRKKRVTPLE